MLTNFRIPLRVQHSTLHDLSVSKKLLLVIFLTFLLRVIWAASIYQDNLLHYHGGDYILYQIGGEDIIAKGLDFSNSLFLVRPPMFPLLIAALGANPMLVLAANILIGLSLIPLTYLLARWLDFEQNFAVLAAAIIAFEPTSIRYSVALLPEPLANLFLLLVVIGIRGMTHRPHPWRWGVLAGVALVFSMLTRPSAYLLWIPLGGWLLIAYRRQWRSIILFTGLAAVGMGGWMLHNYQVFGNGSFSTIGSYNLLYYRAASVERLGTGQDIDDVYAELSRRVEERLGRDTRNITADTHHTHYSSSVELEHAMQSVALEVFFTHIYYYVLTIPMGVVRFLFLTSGLPGLLSYVAIATNGLLTFGALTGLWFYYRYRRWWCFWITLLICLYFIAGTLIVQTSGLDTRARVMLTPLMAIASVFALRHFLRRQLDGNQ